MISRLFFIAVALLARAERPKEVTCVLMSFYIPGEFVRKKQLDWLAANTDDIISQSHSHVLVRTKKKSQSGKRALVPRGSQRSVVRM